MNTVSSLPEDKMGVIGSRVVCCCLQLSVNSHLMTKTCYMLHALCYFALTSVGAAFGETCKPHYDFRKHKISFSKQRNVFLCCCIFVTLLLYVCVLNLRKILPSNLGHCLERGGCFSADPLLAFWHGLRGRPYRYHKWNVWHLEENMKALYETYHIRIIISVPFKFWVHHNHTNSSSKMTCNCKMWPCSTYCNDYFSSNTDRSLKYSECQCVINTVYFQV